MPLKIPRVGHRQAMNLFLVFWSVYNLRFRWVSGSRLPVSLASLVQTSREDPGKLMPMGRAAVIASVERVSQSLQW